MNDDELLRFAKLALSRKNVTVDEEWNPLMSDVDSTELKSHLDLKLRTYTNGLEGHNFVSAQYLLNDGYAGWIHEPVTTTNGNFLPDENFRLAIRHVLVKAAAKMGLRA